jgi:drug/metabolite transporter (DMT)-like permease
LSITTDKSPARRNQVFWKKPGFSKGVSNTRKGYLLVLGAASCWATSGVLYKTIMVNYGPTPLTLAFWRCFLTFCILLVVSLLFRRDLLRVDHQALPLLAGAGVLGVAALQWLWVYAVELIGVAPAHILNYTAPAFVVLFSWLLWREPVTWRKKAALALTFGGCLPVAGAHSISDARLNWIGVLAGLGTGVSWGLYAIFGKILVRRHHSWTLITYAFGIASLALLLPSPIRALTFPLSRPWHLWIWLGLLALVPGVTAYSLYTWGLGFLSASAAAITATSETFFAAVLAALFLGDVLTPWQVVGGILIICGVVIISARKPQTEQVTNGE